MREALKKLVKNSILEKYVLPNLERNIDKTILTCKNDFCFKSDDEKISTVIYNGIIEYACNEYEIDYDNIQTEQIKALASKIRYDSSLPYDSQLKFGFYGEVLLDLLLRIYFNTSVIIAHGYFYSPIENAEAKGFDAFHIIDNEGKTELWLGEAKFYDDYKSAIDKVIDKFNITFSDKYIKKNLITVFNNKKNFSTYNQNVLSLMNDWEHNPEINLITQMLRYKMSIVYPIFIAFEKINVVDYDFNIKKCIDYINKKTIDVCKNFNDNIKIEIYFMFLPIDDVKYTKTKVLEHIWSKEQLI